MNGTASTTRKKDMMAAPSSAQPGATLTGAQALVRSLEEVGATVVFGIPGGAILPAYDPLYDSTRVRHILVRHEQGAGHAAEGYAQATGKVGVCMATSGPGATNLVTPIADAYMDSVPMVAITGQVGRAFIGTDAFQEADISGITLPITKHNFLVQSAAEVPQAIAEAFHLAGTGRPGPVLVDLPKDVLQERAPFVWPPKMDLPGYRPVIRPHGKQVREAARLIAEAKRPVLYIGGGAIKAHATDELRQLAELTGIPVVTTLMARGAFPDSHRQHLGMPGMHGSVTAVTSLQKSDLLIALGTRFDDRVTGRLETFAPQALVIHADIDPAEIGKNRAADVPIVGDVREVIAELIPAVQAEFAAGRRADLAGWWALLAQWRKTDPLGYDDPADRAISAVRERAHRPAGRTGRDLRCRRWATSDVGVAVHLVREARQVAELGRRRDDGICGAGGDGRKGRLSGRTGMDHRWGRLLPDDEPRAGDLRHRRNPDQGCRDQQRQLGHGSAVADPLL
jgi:acetolactate synthase-1/2/3 large subunit